MVGARMANLRKGGDRKSDEIKSSMETLIPIIRAAEVVGNLSTMVDKPKTETQARPLAKLPAAEQPAGAGSC